MLKLTRRVLIKQASIGIGAVSMLAATLTGRMQIGTAATKSAKAAEKSVLAAGESLVICITDPGSGTLSVLRGEQEKTINDVALVHRLLSL